MTLNRLIRTFALASLVSGIASGSLAGETYFKCTKADNTITYMETKPTTTACASIEEIKVNTGRGTPGAHQGNTDSNNDAARKGQEDRETAERNAKMDEACSNRRANLEVLKTSTAITVKNPDGTSKPLSREEVEQRIQDSEKYIKDFCSK